MPEFPGDATAYIRKNIRYPKAAADAGLEGRAVVKILILEDGTPQVLQVVRRTGSSALDSEAVQVIRTMPKWKPARKTNDQPAPCYFHLPVVFRLD